MTISEYIFASPAMVQLGYRYVEMEDPTNTEYDLLVSCHSKYSYR